MPTFNSDDEDIMRALIDITVKWSAERPEAARQGVGGILAAMIKIVQKGTPSSQITDDQIRSLAEDLISHVEENDFEAASRRLDSFLSGSVPSPQQYNEHDPTHE
jgi:hypothetical protein